MQFMMKKFSTTAIQFVAALAVLMLCSCSTKRPALPANSTTAAPAHSEQAADNQAAKKSAETNVFKSQQVITPNQSIDKAGLSVSYSVKTVRNTDDYLIQLTLIFRNLQARSTVIKPKVTLQNEKGQRVSGYTKKQFLKLAGQMANPSAKGSRQLIHDTRSRSAKEKIDWANSNWLKDKHTITPGGIEIAGLVYHSADLSLPMTLTITSLGEKFTFIIKELPLSSEQPE